MKTEIFLYNALMYKAEKENIKPELCKHCSPACQTWNIRMFSKKFRIELLSNSPFVFIESDRFHILDNAGLNISFEKGIANFYNEKYPEIVI